MNTYRKMDLTEIKQSISIIELALELGLEVKNRQARCFNSTMHKNNDRHFSLGLDTRTNRFKCFACGESGSNIDLCMKVSGLTFIETVQYLSKKAGLKSRQTDHGPKNKCRDNSSNKNSLDAVPAFKPQYSTIYCALETFCNGVDQESIDYLTGMKRGLSPETIKRFRIFSIKDYQRTNEFLKTNFSLEDLVGAGLLSNKEGKEGNLIFYKHKIIIPFIADGRILYLQGRRLDDEHPRYLNIRPDVPLFNFDLSKRLKKGALIYICEGVFDAMILQQYDYDAVAILGVNNFKPEMITLFKDFDVVLVLDNDESGKKATKELARLFFLNGRKVKTKQLPENVKDITEYFLRPETF